jgi:hypothetical protein
MHLRAMNMLEDEHAEPREHVDGGVALDGVEPVETEEAQVSEQHAEEELSQDRGLAEACGQVATKLGGFFRSTRSS